MNKYAQLVRNLSYDSAMNVKFWFVLLLAGIATAQPSVVRQAWELVRSVPNGFGGKLDLVVSPKQNNATANTTNEWQTLCAGLGLHAW